MPALATHLLAPCVDSLVLGMHLLVLSMHSLAHCTHSLALCHCTDLLVPSMHLLTLLHTFTCPPLAFCMHTPGSESALSTHCSMHFPIADDSQAQSTHLAIGLHDYGK
jgi:hypothetical protein